MAGFGRINVTSRIFRLSFEVSVTLDGIPEQLLFSYGEVVVSVIALGHLAFANIEVFLRDIGSRLKMAIAVVTRRLGKNYIAGSAMRTHSSYSLLRLKAVTEKKE